MASLSDSFSLGKPVWEVPSPLSGEGSDEGKWAEHPPLWTAFLQRERGPFDLPWQTRS